MASSPIDRKHFLATGLAAVAAVVTGRSRPAETATPASAKQGPKLAPAARTVPRQDLV